MPSWTPVLPPGVQVPPEMLQRSSSTLWLGDLEPWMDETYISKCIVLMGWDIGPGGAADRRSLSSLKVKMNRSASPSSGFCFITFPDQEHAQHVLEHFQQHQQRTLMPGSQRTFKLNWATGLPGVRPRWESEYSIFVGDLPRDVTESELVCLFTSIFPSTRSAKILYERQTGQCKGFGFVRFSDAADLDRALNLSRSTTGTGLCLRGRTLRISEATGDTGTIRRNKPPSPPSSPSTQTDSPPRTPHYPDQSNTTVFVGGLPFGIGEVHLRMLFQTYGEIVYVKIPPNKGCGFVQFKHRHEAEMAISRLHDFQIQPKSHLRLSWGRSKVDKVQHCQSQPDLSSFTPLSDIELARSFQAMRLTSPDSGVTVPKRYHNVSPDDLPFDSKPKTYGRVNFPTGGIYQNADFDSFETSDALRAGLLPDGIIGHSPPPSPLHSVKSKSRLPKPSSNTFGADPWNPIQGPAADFWKV